MDSYGNIYDDPLPSAYRLYLYQKPGKIANTTSSPPRKGTVHAAISNFDAAEKAYRWVFIPTCTVAVFAFGVPGLYDAMQQRGYGMDWHCCRIIDTSYCCKGQIGQGMHAGLTAGP
jgi:hypothetical protein